LFGLCSESDICRRYQNTCEYLLGALSQEDVPSQCPAPSQTLWLYSVAD